MASPVIEVINAKKYFKHQGSLFSRKSTDIKAVDDVSINVTKGEIVGIVGESGSGKTTLARLILGLTKLTGGTVKIDGKDISALGRRAMKSVRRELGVVFQDPASNLNPRENIESSIIRPMIIHGVKRREAKQRAKNALERVKMDERYLKSYPHQLSGGQLQRIAVARALVLQPKIMVLDEPTSALDISIQAQVLNLLLDLQEDMGLTYFIITHDLNVIRYMSDKIAVMYLGSLVEYGNTEEVMHRPIHPYTQGLLAAAPITHPGRRGEKKRTLSGEPGSIISVSPGCRLAPRCPYAEDRCHIEAPAQREVSPGHFCACLKEIPAN